MKHCIALLLALALLVPASVGAATVSGETSLPVMKKVVKSNPIMKEKIMKEIEKLKASIEGRNEQIFILAKKIKTLKGLAKNTKSLEKRLLAMKVAQDEAKKMLASLESKLANY